MPFGLSGDEDFGKMGASELSAITRPHSMTEAARPVVDPDLA